MGILLGRPFYLKNSPTKYPEGPYSFALLVLLTIMKWSRPYFLGIDTNELRVAFQTPLLVSSISGPIVASWMGALATRTYVQASRSIKPRCSSVAGIENGGTSECYVEGQPTDKDIVNKQFHSRIFYDLTKVCSIMCACLIVLSITTYLYLEYKLGPLTAQYDALSWQKAEPAQRGAMARDLARDNILAGASRSRVVEVLGQPNECMLTYETGRFILCLDFVGINCSSVIFTGDEYNIKPLTFSSEEWLSTPTPERALMAADLAARKQLLIGKTREKVVDILGRPTGEQLVYSAGKGTGRFDVIIHDDHVENVNWYRGLE